jgi:uncharacterized membrane protein
MDKFFYGRHVSRLASGADSRESFISVILVAAIIFFATVAGVSLSIMQPALNSPDEIYHWQRAVQVSQGQIFADRQGGQNYGGKIDFAALEFAHWAKAHFDRSSAFSLSQVKRLSDDLQEKHGVSEASFPSSASFSPLAYLPPALGIAGARTFGGGVLTQMIGGRIANVLIYLACIVAAMYLAPYGRRLLLLLALTAPSLHLAASVSGDPLNFALPAMLFDWCLRLRLDQSATLSAQALTGLGLLLVSLSLLKPIYLLLAAIALLIPLRHFNGRRGQVIFLIVVFGAGLGLTLAWNFAYPFVPGRYWGTGADPKLVLLDALRSPLAALAYFCGSLTHQLPIMWLDAWGRIGGYPPPFMTNAPQTLSWVALVVTVALAAAEGQRHRDLSAAAFMLALAVLFTSIIFLAFWLAFSPPNAAVIQGVQGRYFQIAFLLVGWSCVIAAPVGDMLRRLRLPLLCAGLALQMACLFLALDHFYFYWAN